MELFAIALAVASAAGTEVRTPADQADPPAGQTHLLTAADMFELASRAAAADDLALAERVLKTLTQDADAEVRSEARFRLAMMFMKLRRLSESATLLRQILDEQPNAQRVRLELARVLDLLGDETGARRALREAQAGGLPPDVARFVDLYSAALRAQKPFGASIDIALAPDSNINRATRSQTLGTVLGDFVLDENAKQRSGVGIALRGQGYARLPLGSKVNLFGRISGSADLYRDTNFNDFALAATFGPEMHSGADRISLEAGGIWRWYGGEAYSHATTITLNYFHPLGREAQLRSSASVALVDNRLNQLQDGRTYSASLGYERAVSSRAGVGITLSADRQALRDRGYSTWAGQASAFGYRELGPITVVATIGYGKLKADERLSLFPEARSDRFYRASVGATFRSLRIGTFAPFLRATYERNHSTTEIHDYRKLRTELGITKAF